MCGIAGIYSHKPVATELYDSIIHLQHRGQDAAGIMTYDDRMHKEKGMGLAKEVFNDTNMELLLRVILEFLIIDIPPTAVLVMAKYSRFGRLFLTVSLWHIMETLPTTKALRKKLPKKIAAI